MPTGIDLAPGASWLLYLPAQLHVARSPSPPATRALLSRLVLETDERSRGSRSKTDEADAGLLWAGAASMPQVQMRWLPCTRDLRTYCQCSCKSAAFTATDILT